MTVDTVATALRQIGSPLTETDLVAAILAPSLSRQAGVAIVSQSDQEAFVTASGLPLTSQRWIREQLSDRVGLLRIRQSLELSPVISTAESALTSPQVQELLGLSRSGLSRRVSEQRIYAIKDGRQRLFPRWQFHRGPDGQMEVLPGLDVVLKAEADQVHPQSFEALVTTTQDELDGRTPVQWLAGGGDPTPVAALVIGLSTW
ncbi:hypothetical protein KEM60_01662 [Austwickia sp. TVS 96-490-7B]|uniref:helix-turn-helix domain-containing protein n=1 Tax=Austwickia sp. TVS 96-490-7B TaxID=2830843 RepID=UPI001C59D10C|nr:helix-turn-helix domain-containing protein [Austwickia sp. TVS 96-490-7B]MBW3085462.1 hypothetical protein [Austwickia sp. TVS 96-490-7B]